MFYLRNWHFCLKNDWNYQVIIKIDWFSFNCDINKLSNLYSSTTSTAITHIRHRRCGEKSMNPNTKALLDPREAACWLSYFALELFKLHPVFVKKTSVPLINTVSSMHSWSELYLGVKSAVWGRILHFSCHYFCYIPSCYSTLCLLISSPLVATPHLYTEKARTDRWELGPLRERQVLR